MIRSSLLIPVHNAEDTLRQCLSSCRADYTHVFLDQCDDMSLSIAREYPVEITVSPIRFGHAAARAYLYWHADTEAVVFQDADDWRTGAYDFHLQYLEACDVLVTPFIVHDGIHSRHVAQKENVLDDLVYGRIQTGGIYWRSSVLRHLPFPVGGKWEYWLLYHAWKSGARIAYNPTPSVHYRRSWSPHQITASAEYTSEQLRFSHELLKEDLSKDQRRYLDLVIAHATQKAGQ